MNTKLNNIVINPAFEDLFTFKNEEEKIEHDAAMISYRILSEVEKLCDKRQIKKKDLAEMMGTSKSYITQLFNGTKSINTHFMAKLENALGVTFETRLKHNEGTEGGFPGRQADTAFFTNRRLSGPRETWRYYQPGKKTEDLINNLETEHVQKQIA